MIMESDSSPPDFSPLDCLEHLAARRADGRRRVDDGGRNDAVGDLLAACQRPSDLAELACRFGLCPAEVRQKALAAASFGQFRMAVGNRLRGICGRTEQAPRRGRAVSLRRAAYPGKQRGKHYELPAFQGGPDETRRPEPAAGMKT